MGVGTRAKEQEAKKEARVADLQQREDSALAELAALNDRYDDLDEGEGTKKDAKTLEADVIRVINRLEALKMEKKYLTPSVNEPDTLQRKRSDDALSARPRGQLRLPPDIPTYRCGKTSDEPSAADFLELFETKLRSSGIPSDRFGEVLPAYLNLNDSNWLTVNVKPLSNWDSVKARFLAKFWTQSHKQAARDAFAGLAMKPGEEVSAYCTRH